MRGLYKIEFVQGPQKLSDIQENNTAGNDRSGFHYMLKIFNSRSALVSRPQAFKNK
jgi:hypothetical protein